MAIPHFVLLCIFLIFSLVCWTQRRIGCLSCFSVLITFILAAWLISPFFACKKIDHYEYYRIFERTLSNGHKVQLFKVNGEEHNATETFKVIVPSGKLVRRTIYEKVYFGLDIKRMKDVADTYDIVDGEE